MRIRNLTSIVEQFVVTGSPGTTSTNVDQLHAGGRLGTRAQDSVNGHESCDQDASSGPGGPASASIAEEPAGQRPEIAPASERGRRLARLPRPPGGVPLVAMANGGHRR